MKITTYNLEGPSTIKLLSICRTHNFSFPRPPTPITQTHTNIYISTDKDMDYLRLPTEFPNSAHEVIVYLESIHLAVLDVDTGPKTHEMISYHNITEPAAVRERIQCASIIIALKAKINKETLGKAPYL
jgi:hypothetical protein